MEEFRTEDDCTVRTAGKMWISKSDLGIDRFSKDRKMGSGCCKFKEKKQTNVSGLAEKRKARELKRAEAS